MTPARPVTAWAGLFLLVSGCYRTTYMNVTPPEKLEVARATAVSHPPSSGWQHFFLFGWIPSEKVIQTEQVCGGADRVESIHTERSFVQGLVAAVASFYVNIYSPWTGRVVCVGDPPAR